MIRLLGANPQEQQTPDWSLSSLGMNFAAGYLQGLTTFDILKEESPDTMPEYISRSLGSVLGFIGWIPAGGGAARVGFSLAGHTMQLLGDTARATTYLGKSAKYAAEGARFLTGYSIPAAVGKLGLSGMERFFETAAAKSAMSFTESLVGKTVLSQSNKELANAMLQNSMFMGFASAAAARPVTIDPLAYFSADDFKDRWRGMQEGLLFGAAQGGIANAITKGSISKIAGKTFQDLVRDNPKKADYILKSLRAVSTGLSMAAYTSYQHDTPLEYTIYEGLLNGVFGWREVPYPMKEAARIYSKTIHNRGDINSYISKAESLGNMEKFLADKHKIYPSPETLVELELIANERLGQANLNGAVIYEAALKVGALKENKTVEEMRKLLPSDLIKLVGMSDDDVFDNATHSFMKDQAEDEFSRQMEDFKKNNPETTPTPEETFAMDQSALNYAKNKLYENASTLAEDIYQTSKAITLKKDYQLKFAEQVEQIHESFRETGVSQQGVQWARDFNESLVGPEIPYTKVVTDLTNVFFKNKQSGQKNFVPVMEQLQKKLGTTFTAEHTQGLQKLWNMYAYSKPSKEYRYSIDESFIIENAAYKKDGTSDKNVRTRTPFEDELGDDLAEIKEAFGKVGYEGKMKSGMPLHTPYRIYAKDGSYTEHEININKMLHSSYKAGLYFQGNRKDNSHFWFSTKRNVIHDTDRDTYSFTHPDGTAYEVDLENAFVQADRASTKKLGEQQKSQREYYHGERQKYVEDNTGMKFEDVDLIQRSALEGEYDYMTANILTKWLAFNKQPNLAAILSRPGFSIRDALDFNKRFSLLTESGIPLDETIVGKTHLKTMVIENDPESVHGLKNLFGELLENQTDGVLMLYPDEGVSRGFSAITGVSDKVGFHKASIVSSLPTGLFMGKLGVHVVTESEARLLDTVGRPDQVLFTSAAKQTGDVSVQKMRLSDDGTYYLLNGKRYEAVTDAMFEIPVKSIRVNPSAVEDEGRSSTTVMKQMLENASENSELAQHLTQTMVNPSIWGIEQINNTFKKITDGNAEINMDRVGLDHILGSLDGPNFYKNTPQFQKVFRRLLKYQLEKGDEIEEDDGELGIIAQLEKDKSAVSTILNAIGKEGSVTPMLARLAPIRDLLEQIFWKYAKDRAIHPEWENSFKAKMYYSLNESALKDFKTKYNRDFQPGDMMLAVEDREFPIRLPKELQSLFKGKTAKLGEMVDMYEKTEKTPSILESKFGTELVDFFKNYGITIEKGDISYIDAAKKFATVRDIKDLSAHSAEFLSHMLSYSNRYNEFYNEIKDSGFFKSEVQRIGKDGKVTQSEKRDITRKIFKDIIESKFDQEFAKEKGVSPGILKRIQDFFLNLAKRFRDTDWEKIDSKFDDLIGEIKSGKDFIRTTKKEGYEKVDFQKAIDSNPLGREIIEKIVTRPGYELTGSLSFSTQGSVYRPAKNLLHDIDIVAAGKTPKENLELMNELFPNSKEVYLFDRGFEFGGVQTFIVPPKGHSIENLERRKEGNKVISYDVVENVNRKKVGDFKLQYVLAKDKIVDEHEIKNGVEASFVDFFEKSLDKGSSKRTTHSFKGSDGTIKTINVSRFDQSFTAKLSFSRFKDIWDYNRFNPFSPERDILKDFLSRTIVGRAPQSDMSGNRVMKNIVFSGKGSGVGLHPLDMKYLDGDDMDGDQVVVYFGFNKRFVDYADSPAVKHRFSRWFASSADRDAFNNATVADREAFKAGDTRRGLTVKDLLKEGKLVIPEGMQEEFMMIKGTTPLLLSGKDMSHLEQPYSLFSPASLAQAGRSATSGKNSLGPGLVAALRSKQMHKYLIGQTGQFEGYHGGFDNIGKGTPQGDGKDKAMRQIANGFIGEIINENSSSATSKKQLGDPENAKVIMLARNSEFSGKELKEETKQQILQAFKKGSTFVVGDMPGVDSKFIDYLQNIGAKFSIYHTGNRSRIILPSLERTIKVGPYTLKPKATLDEQRLTQADTVNSAADAAEGRAMASTDQVRIAQILSVADVYDSQGKLMKDPARQLEFINYVKELGLKKMPIFGQLMAIDNVMRGVDYDGKKANLQDLLYELRKEQANLDASLGTTKLSSIWYNSVKELSKLRYEPSHADYVNIESRKLILEAMDNFIKSDNPVARMLLESFNRRGISFNLNKVADTAVWQEIQAHRKDSKKLLNDFINVKGSDYRNSELFKAAQRLPDPKRPGEFIDRLDDLKKELAQKSIQAEQDYIKFDEDKRIVTYSFVNKQGETINPAERFDTLTEAEKFIADAIQVSKDNGYTPNEYTTHRVERPYGEQVKVAQNMNLHDLWDATSLLFMHDYISKYLSIKFPGKNLEKGDEEILQFIRDDVKPLLEEVQKVKTFLINTQDSVYNAISQGQKEYSFENFTDSINRIETLRASLKPEQKMLMDAAMLSSIRYDMRPDFQKQAEKLFADSGKKTDNIDTEVMNITNRLIREYDKPKSIFGNYRGRTPFVVGVVPEGMITEFFKKFNTMGEQVSQESKDLVMQRVARAFNMDASRGYLPGFFETRDIQEINTRPETMSEVRKFTSPLKHVLLEQHGKTAIGNIKDPKERAMYQALVDETVQNWKDMPEQMKEFQWMLPVILSKYYGKEFAFAADGMTKQDLKLYNSYLRGQKYDPKDVPKVTQSFFFRKFGEIANAMRRHQIPGTLIPYEFKRPVVTAEGPVSRQKVMDVLGHYDVFYQLAQANNIFKNSIDDKMITLFDNNFFLIGPLNRDHLGVGSKIMEAAISLGIEEPLSRSGHESAKMYADNAVKGQKIFDSIKQDKFVVNDAEGKTITMSKQGIFNYFVKGIHNTQDLFNTYLNNRPHDKLLVYKNESIGPDRLQEIDLLPTVKNLLDNIVRTGGNSNDLSYRALVRIAAQISLESKDFNFYSTPNGLFLETRANEWLINKFRLEVEQGNTDFKPRTVRWNKASPAEKELVFSELYSANNYAGFNISENYAPLGRAYFSHTGTSKSVFEEFLRERFTKLIPKMPVENAKKLSFKAIRTAMLMLKQTDDPEFGLHVSAKLWDQKDALSTGSVRSTVLENRSLDTQVPDYDMTPAALLTTQRKILRQNSDMQFVVLSKYLIDDMIKKQVFGEQTMPLTRFAQRYVKQTLGFMDTTPRELGDENNPYGMTTNIFKFHNDNYWSQKITAIADTWFGKKIFPEYEQLGAIASEIKFANDNDKKKWIDQGKKIMSEQKISWLSQMEAKWSLLSLLTSAKTAFTNIGSAEIMTFMNSGSDAYMKTFRLKDIQAEMGADKVRNMGDVKRMFSLMGGLESHFANDMALNGDYLPVQISKAIGSIMSRAGEGKWTDLRIGEELKKAGVWDTVFQKAGWFMKASERLARERSMLSHYINARRLFKMQGFELEYDDPWIMQIAREGVKSSQFLYSNAERPAFMASAVGKMFHRFQLYTYNSIEYRANVLKQARATGIAPGSDTYDRFNRMMVSDLFMFGMASLLPYTIFGSALQPPYNYLQNSLKFLFGDGEEKKRAFGNVNETVPFPGNMLLPAVPAGGRPFVQLFGFMYSPSVQAVEDAVVSWMPFQRIGKDIMKSIENPANTFENMTGWPLWMARSAQYERQRLEIRTFDKYLDSYRLRNTPEKKKIEAGIQSYLDQFPPPN